MRSRLIFLAMAIAYWCGIDALFYRLNRKAKRIICFHSVLPDALKLPGLTCGLDNTESEFRQIVREVKRLFPVTNDLFDSSSVTFTFDDGFLNQFEIAGRILKEEDVPAILFVVGSMIDNKDSARCLMVERILAWTTYAPEEVVLKFADSHKQGAGRSRSAAWSEVIFPLFTEDMAGMGANVYQLLDGLYPYEEVLASLPNEYKRLRMTGVSRAQIDELRKRGWTIGWHTKSHFPLSKLTDSEIRRELATDTSLAREVMAFPFGSSAMVDSRAIRVVEQNGHPAALSFMSNPGKMLCRHFMPRLFVRPNKYELHFELSGLKHFVRERKLFVQVHKICG